MKKMSIILILLSSALSIVSHLINQIDSMIISLPMFYPSVDILIRFGDLMIIFGFIGFFLTTKKYPKIKLYSILFAVFGLIRFLLVEFGVTESYSLMSNFILLSQILVLFLWLLQVRIVNIPLLTIKGYSLITIASIYFITLQVISLIPHDLSNSSSSPTLTVLPFFIIGYQIGIWIFFREWYKEAYIYKNPDLSHI